MDDLAETNNPSAYYFMLNDDLDLYIRNDSNVSTGDNEDLAPWCLAIEASDVPFSPYYYPYPYSYIVASIDLFFLIFIVVFNSIIVVVVIIDRRLRKITGGLIVSMAVADLLIGLTSELHSVISLFQRDEFVPQLAFTCQLTISADIYFGLCELLHLVCLAMERYVAICHPFTYERCGNTFLTCTVTLCWTLPLCFSFLPLLSFWDGVTDRELHGCLNKRDFATCHFFPNQIFSSVLFVVMFVLPTSLLLFCYTQILRVCLKHSREMRKQSNLTNYFEKQDALKHKRVMEEESSNKLRCPVDDSKMSITNSGLKSASFYQEEAPFLLHSTPVDAVDRSQSSLTLNKLRVAHKRFYPNVSSSSYSLATLKLGFKTQFSKWDICRALCGIDDFFRASRSIVYVCICYLLTWTPYWTLIFLAPFVGVFNVPKFAELIAVWLFALGTAINPFVYYFSNTEIRKGMTRVGRKLCLKCTGHCRSANNQ